MLANKIERIRIHNYKSLADIDVTLEDLTVLVGVNGSGKSNFIDVFRFVQGALLHGLDEESQKHRPIFSLYAHSPQNDLDKITIDLSLRIDNTPAEYKFVLGARGENVVVKQERCDFGDDFYEVNDGTLTSASDKNLKLESKVRVTTLALPLMRNLASSKFEPVYTFLVQMYCYSILPQNFVSPQRSKDPFPLTETADNLASTLQALIENPNQTKNQSKYLYESLAAIIPVIAADNPITIVEPIDRYLFVRIKHANGDDFDLESESDGIKHILTLLTALYQRYDLPFLAIEEPELYLHPHAMAILCDDFLAASLKTQVIVTTHSPDLIARFNAKNLRVVDLVEGITEIGVLREDQREVIEKQIFNGGDLLRIEGLKRE